MGYCVCITREIDWVQRPQAPIKESDWMAIVERDSSLSVPRHLPQVRRAKAIEKPTAD
jgi:hypothetical protein